MSVRYAPVGWNRNKIIYDVVLLAAVVAYILIFIKIAPSFQDVTRPTSGAILRAQAFGSCAFLMLTFILCIGPLARLDTRFLPLLYNRRHFGVITCAVAFTHASSVVSIYYSFSPLNKYVAVLASNSSYDRFLGFPFETFGILRVVPASGACGDESRLLAQVPDTADLEGDPHFGLCRLCVDRLPRRARLAAVEAKPASSAVIRRFERGCGHRPTPCCRAHRTPEGPECCRKRRGGALGRRRRCGVRA